MNGDVELAAGDADFAVAVVLGHAVAAIAPPQRFFTANAILATNAGKNHRIFSSCSADSCKQMNGGAPCDKCLLRRPREYSSFFPIKPRTAIRTQHQASNDADKNWAPSLLSRRPPRNYTLECTTSGRRRRNAFFAVVVDDDGIFRCAKNRALLWSEMRSICSRLIWDHIFDSAASSRPPGMVIVREPKRVYRREEIS